MGRGIVARYEGEPVAFLGCVFRHPGLCEAFAGGTEKFPMVAMTLTRYALRVMKPELIAAGVRRIQCQSLATHVDAHRWLERLGFRREAVLRCYGRGSKDYYMFAAIASDFARNQEERPSAFLNPTSASHPRHRISWTARQTPLPTFRQDDRAAYPRLTPM
jgi:hypothetical protein